jgi:hypothetical protein
LNFNGPVKGPAAAILVFQVETGFKPVSTGRDCFIPKAFGIGDDGLSEFLRENQIFFSMEGVA